jgi:hypothetical protein
MEEGKKLIRHEQNNIRKGRNLNVPIIEESHSLTMHRRS